MTQKPTDAEQRLEKAVKKMRKRVRKSGNWTYVGVKEDLMELAEAAIAVHEEREPDFGGMPAVSTCYAKYQGTWYRAMYVSGMGNVLMVRYNTIGDTILVSVAHKYIEETRPGLKELWEPCDQTVRCSLCGWIDWPGANGEDRNGPTMDHWEFCPECECAMMQKADLMTLQKVHKLTEALKTAREYLTNAWNIQFKPGATCKYPDFSVIEESNE